MPCPVLSNGPQMEIYVGNLAVEPSVYWSVVLAELKWVQEKGFFFWIFPHALYIHSEYIRLNLFTPQIHEIFLKNEFSVFLSLVRIQKKFHGTIQFL